MATPPSLKRPSGEDGPGGPSKKPKAGPDQEEIQKMVAEARARAAAVASKLAGRNSANAPPGPQPSNAAPVTSAADRMAALRSRIASAVGRSSAAATPAHRSHTPQYLRREEHERDDEAATRARGGLDVGLHPALLGDSLDVGGARKGKNTMHPKFATTMANRRDGGKSGKKQLDLSGPSPELTDPSKNPYYDPNIGAKPTQSRRVSKALMFNQKGKYIEQANAMRRQEALEEMKKRIAVAARKVGIDEEIHADKAFAPQEPPSIEWWDQGLTANSSYDDIISNNLRVDTDDSIVTVYIQHPIQLDPPQDKHIPAAKPLPLTKKEQAKVRRQRRAADLKEKQDKVRLGLEPPPPPKVKKSNMMRVLGEEAVKDPTAVEARVNREIAERLDKHLQVNEERKLTKEQRLQKLEGNQQKDVALGVHVLVFRVESVNAKHKFKINKNAEQLALTGICLFNPKFNLVIVEGGSWAITKYKKLMIHRIDWKENVDPADGEETNAPAPEEMAHNKCTLVWEGETRQRRFKKFTCDRCPTDAMAKEKLERAQMETMWTLAKTSVQKDE